MADEPHQQHPRGLASQLKQAARRRSPRGDHSPPLRAALPSSSTTPADVGAADSDHERRHVASGTTRASSSPPPSPTQRSGGASDHPDQRHRRGGSPSPQPPGPPRPYAPNAPPQSGGNGIDDYVFDAQNYEGLAYSPSSVAWRLPDPSAARSSEEDAGGFDDDDDDDDDAVHDGGRRRFSSVPSSDLASASGALLGIYERKGSLAAESSLGAHSLGAVSSFGSVGTDDAVTTGGAVGARRGSAAVADSEVARTTTTAATAATRDMVDLSHLVGLGRLTEMARAKSQAAQAAEARRDGGSDGSQYDDDEDDDRIEDARDENGDDGRRAEDVRGGRGRSGAVHEVEEQRVGRGSRREGEGLAEGEGEGEEESAEVFLNANDAPSVPKRSSSFGPKGFGSPDLKLSPRKRDAVAATATSTEGRARKPTAAARPPHPREESSSTLRGAEAAQEAEEGAETRTPRDGRLSPSRGAATAVASSPASLRPSSSESTSAKPTSSALSRQTSTSSRAGESTESAATTGTAAATTDEEQMRRAETEAAAQPGRPRTLMEARMLAKERSRLRQQASSASGGGTTTSGAAGHAHESSVASIDSGMRHVAAAAAGEGGGGGGGSGGGGGGGGERAGEAPKKTSLDRPKRDPKRAVDARHRNASTATNPSTAAAAAASARGEDDGEAARASFQSERSDYSVDSSEATRAFNAPSSSSAATWKGHSRQHGGDQEAASTSSPRLDGRDHVAGVSGGGGGGGEGSPISSYRASPRVGDERRFGKVSPRVAPRGVLEGQVTPDGSPLTTRSVQLEDGAGTPLADADVDKILAATSSPATRGRRFETGRSAGVEYSVGRSTSTTREMAALQDAVGDALADVSFGGGSSTSETASVRADDAAPASSGALVRDDGATTTGDTTLRAAAAATTTKEQRRLPSLPSASTLYGEASRDAEASDVVVTSPATPTAASYAAAAQQQQARQASPWQYPQQTHPPPPPPASSSARPQPPLPATRPVVYGRTAHWPSAFDARAVSSQRRAAPWDRAKAYANAANELASTPTNLEVWMLAVRRPAQVQLAAQQLQQQRAGGAGGAGGGGGSWGARSGRGVAPTGGAEWGGAADAARAAWHGRQGTEGSGYAMSVRSDATFPMRGDGGKAREVSHTLEPTLEDEPLGNVAPAAAAATAAALLPPNLPYPSLVHAVSGAGGGVAMVPNPSQGGAQGAMSAEQVVGGATTAAPTTTIGEQRAAPRATDEPPAGTAMSVRPGFGGSGGFSSGSGGSGGGGGGFFSSLGRRGSKRTPGSGSVSALSPSLSGGGGGGASGPRGPRGISKRTISSPVEAGAAAAAAAASTPHLPAPLDTELAQRSAATVTGSAPLRGGAASGLGISGGSGGGVVPVRDEAVTPTRASPMGPRPPGSAAPGAGNGAATTTTTTSMVAGGVGGSPRSAGASGGGRPLPVVVGGGGDKRLGPAGLGGEEKRGTYYGVTSSGGIYSTPKPRGTGGDGASVPASGSTTTSAAQGGNGVGGTLSTPTDYRQLERTRSSGSSSLRPTTSPRMVGGSVGGGVPGLPAAAASSTWDSATRSPLSAGPYGGGSGGGGGGGGSSSSHEAVGTTTTATLSAARRPMTSRSSLSYGSVRKSPHARSEGEDATTATAASVRGPRAATGGSSAQAQDVGGAGGGTTARPATAADAQLAETLAKLSDVLPDADEATLRHYLARARGDDLAAIGDYLQDQSLGRAPAVGGVAALSPGGGGAGIPSASAAGGLLGAAARSATHLVGGGGGGSGGGGGRAR